MSKAITTEEFIERAKKVHNDKYSYKQTVYLNQSIPVKIFCKACNTYFEQFPTNHMRGRGCKKCGRRRTSEHQRMTIAQFITKAKEIHGDKYDYSEVIYSNNRSKVKIYCKNCKNYFFQIPSKHLSGQDCNCYKNIKIHNKRCASKEEFIAKATEVHGDKYDYSNVDYYNGTTRVRIVCKKCKSEFLQTPTNHIRKRGCPYCRQSKGELRIEKWLKENRYRFISQKIFKDCKDKQPLKFDFYLPDYKTCIEFQGKQHYTTWRLEKDDSLLQKRRHHDKIKKEYCYKNNISLIEILYSDNIEKRLEETLNAK